MVYWEKDVSLAASVGRDYLDVCTWVSPLYVQYYLDVLSGPGRISIVRHSTRAGMREDRSSLSRRRERCAGAGDSRAWKV